MIRSLWTAAGGMATQQTQIDAISNNLSNVNTTGFKKSRVEFQDLLYQTLRDPGTRSDVHSMYPTGIQIGSGARVSATQNLFVQGTPKATGKITDLAVLGPGFFKVRLKDGSVAYTRDGSFTIDAAGDLVNSSGHYLEPPLRFDPGVILSSIKISDDGFVVYKSSFSESNEEQVAGDVTLSRFVNPAGLKNLGGNLFQETVASGIAFDGIPGTTGYGKLMSGFLESSNVQIVEEMVNMIVAQRVYEFSSKAVQTSDHMLGIAASLKR